MDSYTYTTASLATIFNQAKEILLDELERQHHLKVPAEKLKTEWAFVVVEKGWLGSFLDRLLFKDKESGGQIRLVKILGHAEPEYKLKERKPCHLTPIN